MRSSIGLLLLVSTSYAASVPFAADPALVAPYSYELEEQGHLRKPFLAHFEKDGRNLYFLASKHENTDDSKTFKLIRQVFKDHVIRTLVIEGYPNEKGDNPEGFLDYAKESCAGSFCRGGEPVYAALSAVEKGASFVGGEPAHAQIFSALAKMGYTTEDMLGFYFVRQLPEYKRERRLGQEKPRALFEDFTSHYARELGPEKVAAFSFEKFKRWYRRKNGKPFSLSDLDSEETAPLARGEYFTQRISSDVGLIRNRFVADLLARRLDSDQDVLIVFGGSHYFSLRPALEALLGKPEIEAPAQ